MNRPTITLCTNPPSARRRLRLPLPLVAGIVVCLLFSCSSSPEHEATPPECKSTKWARALTSDENSSIAHVQFNEGRIIWAGFAGGTEVTFGSEFIGKSPGRGDVVVASMTPDGEILWARIIGGEVSDSVADLDTDDSMSAVIAGQFNGASLQVGPKTVVHPNGSPCTPGSSCSADYLDGFAVRFDAEGETVWAKAFGSPLMDIITGAAMVTGGTVVGGSFPGGTFQCDSVSAEALAGACPPGAQSEYSGQADIFLLHFDQDGEPQKIQVLGGPCTDRLDVVAPSRNGGIMLVGRFHGNEISLGPDSVEGLCEHVSVDFVSPSYRPCWTMFAAELGADGSLVWATVITGGDVEAVAGTTDSSGNVYVAGTFTNASLQVADTTLDNPDGHNSEEPPDDFLVKLAPDGDVIWAISSANSGSFVPRAMSVGPDDHVYLGGYLRHVKASIAGRDLKAEPAPECEEWDCNRAFVVEVDGNGESPWGTAFHVPEHGALYGLTVTNSGSIIAAGSFDAPVWQWSDASVATQSGSDSGWIGVLRCGPAGR